MNSFNGQFISSVTKNIYSSDPSFFKHVFNYDKKNGKVTFKEVLVNRAHSNNVVNLQANSSIPSTQTNQENKVSYDDWVGKPDGKPESMDKPSNNSHVDKPNGIDKVPSKPGKIYSATELNEIFHEAGEKYNVSPKLLKAIGKVESGFNPRAVSPAGAKGIMQLMPVNIKAAGVTDPFDARQNIMAGAKEISGYLKKYKGNLDLALAAYNAGIGNVAKYGGVPPFKETQNFIKKVKKYMHEDLLGGDIVKAKSYNLAADRVAYEKNLANVKIKY